MRWNLFTTLMLGYVAICAVIFASELRSFEQTHQYASGTQVQIPEALRTPRVSLSATFDALMACSDAMSPPLVWIKPKHEISQSARTCKSIADQTLRWMPTHGFAYFVAAQSEHVLENPKKREQLLALSVNYSRFEGWLAQRRFVLAMNSPGIEPEFSSAATNSDIATLLTTQSGADLLAGYYYLRPNAQKLIAPVLERSSPDDQTRLQNLLIKRRAAS